MTHKEIYKQFTSIFAEFSSSIAEWFPNGKNSIRIRMMDGNDFIFTVDGKDWCFETKKNFVKQLKKRYFHQKGGQNM